MSDHLEQYYVNKIINEIKKGNSFSSRTISAGGKTLVSAKQVGDKYVITTASGKTYEIPVSAGGVNEAERRRMSRSSSSRSSSTSTTRSSTTNASSTKRSTPPKELENFGLDQNTVESVIKTMVNRKSQLEGSNLGDIKDIQYIKQGNTIIAKVRYNNWKGYHTFVIWKDSTGNTRISWKEGFDEAILKGKNQRSGADFVTEENRFSYHTVDYLKGSQTPVHTKQSLLISETKKRLPKDTFRQALINALTEQGVDMSIIQGIRISPSKQNPLAYRFTINAIAGELEIPKNIPKDVLNKYLAELKRQLNQQSTDKIKYSYVIKNGKIQIIATITDEAPAYKEIIGGSSSLKNVSIPLSRTILENIRELEGLKQKYGITSYGSLSAKNVEELNKKITNFNKDIEEVFAYKTLNEIRKKNPEYYKILIQFLDLGKDNRLSIKELEKAIRDTNEWLSTKSELRMIDVLETARQQPLYFMRGSTAIISKAQQIINDELTKLGLKDNAAKQFAAGLIEGFFGTLAFYPTLGEAIIRDLLNKNTKYTKMIAEGVIDFFKTYKNKIFGSGHINSYDIGLFAGMLAGGKLLGEVGRTTTKTISKIKELPLNKAINEALRVYVEKGIKGLHEESKKVTANIEKSRGQTYLFSTVLGVEQLALYLMKKLKISYEEALALAMRIIQDLDKRLRIIKDEKVRSEVIKEILKNAKNEKGKLDKQFVEDVKKTLDTADKIHLKMEDAKVLYGDKIKELLKSQSKKEIVQKILRDPELKKLFDYKSRQLIKLRRMLDELTIKYGNRGALIRRMIMQEIFNTLMQDPVGRVFLTYFLYKLYKTSKISKLNFENIQINRLRTPTRITKTTTREVMRSKVRRTILKESKIKMKDPLEEMIYNSKPITIYTPLILELRGDTVDVRVRKLGVISSIPITKIKTKLKTLYKILNGEIIKLKLTTVELQKLAQLIAQHLITPEIAIPKLQLKVTTIQIPQVATIQIPKVNLAVRVPKVVYNYRRSKKEPSRGKGNKKSKKSSLMSRGKLKTRFKK